MISTLILESLRLYPTELKKQYDLEYQGLSLHECFDVAASVSISNKPDKLARLTYLRDYIEQLSPKSDVSELWLDCDYHFPKVFSKSAESNKTYSLATTEYVPTTLKNHEVTQRKYMILFQPNAGIANQAHVDPMSFAIKHDMVVIAFNYKGVWGSEGYTRCADDLVEDGLAQVNRLLQLGVPPENILLKGHSLGGATATLVAAKLHEQKKCVFLWADRTFSSLKDFARYLVVNYAQISNRFIRALAKVFGAILTPVVLALTGWRMDVASAYKKIPQNFKYHINCLKEQDGLIPKKHSLDFSLKSHRYAIKETFKNNKAILEDIKSSFKAHRFYVANQASQRGHDCDYDDLICADGSGRTASQVLSQFCFNRFKSFYAQKDIAESDVKNSYGYSI